MRLSQRSSFAAALQGPLTAAWHDPTVVGSAEGPMRLYITVTVLTFMGCWALYSGSHMVGAARAVGGNQFGASATDVVKNFNPFALLQTDRLRSLLSRDPGLPRMEPVRWKFDSDMLRGMRTPTFDSTIGRNVYITPPPQVGVPQIHTPPPIRFHR
jgi:hypothetical protein